MCFSSHLFFHLLCVNLLLLLLDVYYVNVASLAFSLPNSLCESPEEFSHWGMLQSPDQFREGKIFTLQNPSLLDWFLSSSMSPQMILQLMRCRVQSLLRMLQITEITMWLWLQHPPTCVLTSVQSWSDAYILWPAFCLQPLLSFIQGQKFYPKDQPISLGLILCFFLFFFAIPPSKAVFSLIPLIYGLKPLHLPSFHVFSGMFWSLGTLGILTVFWLLIFESKYVAREHSLYEIDSSKLIDDFWELGYDVI